MFENWDEKINLGIASLYLTEIEVNLYGWKLMQEMTPALKLKKLCIKGGFLQLLGVLNSNYASLSLIIASKCRRPFSSLMSIWVLRYNMLHCNVLGDHFQLWCLFLVLFFKKDSTVQLKCAFSFQETIFNFDFCSEIDYVLFLLKDIYQYNFDRSNVIFA